MSPPPRASYCSQSHSLTNKGDKGALEGLAAPGMGSGLQRAREGALDKSSSCGLRCPTSDSRLCDSGQITSFSEPQFTGTQYGADPSAHPQATRHRRRPRRVLRGLRSPGAGTHLRRTSGTDRGSATRCPGPRRTRCRRTRTAAGWPTGAALRPWPRSSARGAVGARPPGAPSRPARPGDGPAPLPRPLARFLIANLINGARVGGARLVNG